MTAAEFSDRAIGIPWVRWRSDWQACDCFGLVVLYHREVLGINLGAVPNTSISEGFFASSGWEESMLEPEATAFMAWRNDAPTHCGIVLPGAMLMHCEGLDDHPGSARITRLEVVRRIYGQLKFYRRAPC
jgi:hypothetical protein